MNQSKPNRAWAVWIALLTMLLTLVPYLIGWSFSDNRHFMWLGFNIDDSCVYLSWMRQAADGSFRALNLFTTDAQHGMILNPLFLILGWVARLTHLPLLAVYHLSRLAFGFGLLLLVWEFIRTNVVSVSAQRLAFLCVCFASGLGWILPLWNLAPTNAPIDTWQPEAITFLSLYLSPLFCFSMALQVGILLLLQKGERTGLARFAAAAGVCGFVLGMVHTYDIITMAAIWSVYLVVRLALPALKRDFPPLPGHAWLHALIAGVITAPAVAYIAWQLHTETVFRARADVQTLAPPFIWVLLGYGILLALSILGIVAGAKQNSTPVPNDSDEGANLPARTAPQWFTQDAFVLLIVWALANLAVSYAPLAFQRKMLQGEHIPIAILAGVGLAWILSQDVLAKDIWRQRIAAGLALFLLMLTNLMFILRDIGNYERNRAQTNIHRTYLKQGELDALDWIKANTPAGTALQPLPWIAAGEGHIGTDDTALACFTPGLINHPVYCGHWGETPDFGGKLNDSIRILRRDIPDEQRIELLRKMKVDYLIFSQKNVSDETQSHIAPFFLGTSPLPPYLIKTYSNDDADVYRVQL